MHASKYPVRQSSLRAAFLSPFPSSSSITNSSSMIENLASLRTLSRRHAWPRITRKRRVRSALGTPDPSPEPSDQETSETSSEDQSPEIDVEDAKLQVPLPSIFETNGNPECEQCTGAGEIECPVCSGTGFFSLTMMDTVSSTQCRMCQGHKIIPCPSCRQVVYKSVLWWDQVPSEEDDPEEKWRDGEDGPRFRWGENPAD